MTSKPKILFLDIETQPDLIWAWGVYEENAISVEQHWQMISFSAEWNDGGHITKALCDYDGYKPGGDDKKLAKDIWKLLDQADIVVAHNGANFDVKKCNARFIAHGFQPPSPYKVVDTKRELRKVAAYSSNKLDWICQQLEIGKKVEHNGWQLWFDCMAGKPEAWAKMKKYNRHDVVLLKELYHRLSPWINQPNAVLWSGGERCVNPDCGSKHIQWRGVAKTKTRVYRRFQCAECGKWGQAVKAEKHERATVKPVN